jgi:hypothetical protein
MVGLSPPFEVPRRQPHGRHAFGYAVNNRWLPELDADLLQNVIEKYYRDNLANSAVWGGVAFDYYDPETPAVPLRNRAAWRRLNGVIRTSDTLVMPGMLRQWESVDDCRYMIEQLEPRDVTIVFLEENGAFELGTPSGKAVAKLICANYKG